MKVLRSRPSAVFILIFTVFCSDRAWAQQAALEPEQLPSRTLFYLAWHGTPKGEVRKSNALLALWDDSDLAPLRASMLQNMQNDSGKNSAKPALTAQEIEETSTLLENSFVLGYVRKSEMKLAASKTTERPWNGIFFVYDRSGKETLLAKTILRFRSQEKEQPQVSQITVAGAPALKIERKDSVTYWTDHGKYAVSAGDLRVLEDLLSRLDGKAAAASLGQVPAYQEARSLLHGGVLEFFLGVPQLKEFVPDTTPNMPVKVAPILDALRVDSIHSISGRLTLDGARSRVQAAILGDAVPGTPFDLWTVSEQNPPSLAFVTPDTISYSDTHFNFSAFYDLLKRALRVALPQQQQGAAEMVEGFAATRLGMPVPDALALLSGEFGSLQADPGMDPKKAVYFIGIHQKPETLKLLRTIFSDQLSSERSEGDTTFMKVSLGGGQNTTGIAQWNFYHLAVTPNFVLVSSRRENLSTTLASRAQGNGAAGLPAGFRSARSQFPAAINGVSFANLSKMDWPAIKANWIEETRKASVKAAKSGANSSSDAQPGQVPEWLKQINPEVFPRHLHFVAGASWKDSKGIHIDEWLE